MAVPAPNTYYIYDAADLKQLADEVNGTVSNGSGGFLPADNKSGKTYKLANNIDLSVYAPGTTLGGSTGWTPIGKDATTVFAGVFDGENHTIAGLKINDPTADYRGLFGCVQGADNTHKAQIENIIVENADVSGKAYVGAVVGYCSYFTEPLMGCSMAGGSVTGTSSRVGGVAGAVANSISFCSATGTVSGSTASLSGNNSYTGGVVGSVALDISNCFAIGDVTGAECVGGVVGFANQNVTDCYATGDVSGTIRVGGVVAYVNDSVTACFAAGSVTGTENVGGVVGRAWGAAITGCVMLGRSVSGTAEIGRVIGSMKNNATAAACYAWSDTMLNDSPTAGGMADNQNGADVIASDGLLYTATGTFNWPEFETDVWELRNTETAKLPRLVDMASDPTMNLSQQIANMTAYTVTLDPQGGTGGSASTTAHLGEAVSAITPPTRANYVFNGYFDAATGGTRYYNADGTGAKTWDKAANTTLYAQWTQIAFTVTVSAVPAAGGTVTGGGTGLTGGATVTAAPNPNYVFVAWQENGVSVSTDASYPLALTGDHALTAVFRYTGTNPPDSSNGVSGIAAGQSYTKGSTVTFTVLGGGMDNASPAANDRRWLPTHWETNPSGNFDTGFTQSFSTADMTVGAHTLTVTFTQQRYDGTAWVSTGTTDQKSVAFTVAAAPETQDTPETPDTGDHSTPNLWIGLAGSAFAGIVFSASLLRRKRRAHQ